MEIFHASNLPIELPDTFHSRKGLDFGPGFYLTTIRQQAERYAARFTRRKEAAWLNICITPPCIREAQHTILHSNKCDA